MRTAGQRFSGWLLAAALLLHIPWPPVGETICLRALPFAPFPTSPSSAGCQRDCCDHAAPAAAAILPQPASPGGNDCCIACATDTWFKCEITAQSRLSTPLDAIGAVAAPLPVRAARAGVVIDARPPGGWALAHLRTVILRL